MHDPALHFQNLGATSKERREAFRDNLDWRRIREQRGEYACCPPCSLLPAPCSLLPSVLCFSLASHSPSHLIGGWRRSECKRILCGHGRILTIVALAAFRKTSHTSGGRRAKLTGQQQSVYSQPTLCFLVGAVALRFAIIQSCGPITRIRILLRFLLRQVALLISILMICSTRLANQLCTLATAGMGYDSSDLRTLCRREWTTCVV